VYSTTASSLLSRSAATPSSALCPPWLSFLFLGEEGDEDDAPSSSSLSLCASPLASPPPSATRPSVVALSLHPHKPHKPPERAC